MRVLALSRLIHVDSEGQQKSSGSLVSLQLAYEAGQESELLGSRSRVLNACDGPILDSKVKSNSMDNGPLMPRVEHIAILAIEI